MSSGNWYVSPLNVTVSNTVLPGEPATPAVGGSPFRVSNAANLMSLPKFASQHTLWYRKVRALAPRRGVQLPVRGHDPPPRLRDR